MAGIAAWMHYNPQRADPAVLDGITGGASRLALLDELMGTLRAEIGRKNHQHQLLVGPRGAGKTHLLRVLAYRWRQHPALEAAWWPVVLPEEVAIRGPADLLGVVLEKLLKDLPTHVEARAPLLEARVALKGLPRGGDALEVADDALKKAAAVLGRSLVVVVENLDGVLYVGPGGSRSKAGDEQWALRKRLQSAAHILVIGAAPTHFGAASDAGAAFHGFFREHRVEGLPTAEVLSILEHRLEREAGGDSERAGRAKELLRRMPERRGSLAGILRLTGGLPRFVHLIVDLLLDSEDGEVGDLMDRLLDEQTPLFQSRLDPRLVAPQELEALAELARADGPLRPAELARRVSISGAEASVLLERLRERGLTRRAGRSGNATTWDVGEPLYRVWMAFREGGEPRSRMEALAGVVAALWDQEELEEKRADAEKRGDTGGRELYAAAMRCGAVDGREAEPESGRWELAYQEEKATCGEMPSAAKLPSLCGLAYQTGRYAEAARLATEALALAEGDEARAWALYDLGRAELQRQPIGAGVAHLAEAADTFGRIGDARMAAWAHSVRATGLGALGRRTEALQALQEAERRWGVDISPQDRAWCSLLKIQLDPERAEAHADVVFRFGGEGYQAHAHYVLALRQVGNGRTRRAHFVEGLALYRRNGDHDSTASCLAYLARESAHANDLGAAATQWFAAIAEVKGTGVHALRCCKDLAWLAVHAAAIGDAPLAARALRVLAAATSDEDAPDADAQAALLDAAARLVALRPPEEAIELLTGAHGDLRRERRALLEPFVLAARCLTEPREAVLLEQPEEMRRVVDDVVARVVRLKKKPPPEPGWFTTGDVTRD